LGVCLQAHGECDYIIFTVPLSITIIGTDLIRMYRPSKVLEWKPLGRRNRGRPRKRWIEDIENDTQIMGI
jgi:hypothetical protein